MAKWRDCIVVLMDLIGVKKWALQGHGKASKSMLRFHQLVRKEMSTGLRSLRHAYVWNDAVLLLAYVDDRDLSYREAIQAADDLKRKIDATTPCYAIAVKGRTFPSKRALDSSRVTIIEASSYAMANCFGIEAEAKVKKLRNDWYVDHRIARKVSQAIASEWISVTMLPDGRRRKVHIHNGNLWCRM